MKTKQLIILLFTLFVSPLRMLSQEEAPPISEDSITKLFASITLIYKRLPEEKNMAIEFQDDYNQGRIFYNQGIDIFNDHPFGYLRSEIDSVETVFYEQFNLALPYFEKTHELYPNDKNTLLALIAIYGLLGDSARSAKYEKELDLLNKTGEQ